VVLAKPVSYNSEDDADEEVELEGYRINDSLHEMIKDSRSEHPEGFELEAEDDSEENDKEDDDEEEDNEDNDKEDDEDEDEGDAE